MAELLTREIAEEYRKRAKALPDTAGQDIRERRELRIELQNRCGYWIYYRITEFHQWK